MTEKAGSWMDRLALEIEEDPARIPGQTLVCASGISPSGLIHLGGGAPALLG